MISLSKELIGNENLINKLITSFNNKTLSNSIIFNRTKRYRKIYFSTFILLIKLLNSIYQTPGHSSNTLSNLIYKNSHPNIKYRC